MQSGMLNHGAVFLLLSLQALENGNVQPALPSVSAVTQVLLRVGRFISYCFSPQTVCFVQPRANIKVLYKSFNNAN